MLLKLVDAGLWSIIFIGPHLFGGRHLLGRFIILSLCIVTAVVWFWRQLLIPSSRWIRSWSMGLIGAALAWVGFQLAPLPDEWLAALAPRLEQILPLWNMHNSEGAQLGRWQTLSLAPEETRLALATLVAYGLLFVTTVQRIESIDDIKRITRWIGFSAVVVAGLGVVQYFTSNGKFLWFYEYSYTNTFHEVKAGFTSRNHFAHFLVLGLANLVASVMRCRRVDKSPQRRSSKKNFSSDNRLALVQDKTASIVLMLAVTLVIFAILASLSRGGVLAMGSAIAVSAAIYVRARILNSTHVAAGGLLIVVMMAALTFSGNYEHVAQRMESLTSGSVDQLDGFGGRRQIWSANVAAFRAGWLTGSGAGTHRFIYPLYMQELIPTEYTHAENGYLQIATENGLPGILLLVVGGGTCLIWCIRAIRNAASDRELNIVAGGLAAALVASAIHSVVDFVWFIPACMTITILLAASALRLAQLTAHLPEQPHYQSDLTTISKFNVALAASMAGLWALFILFPAAKSSLEWESYHFADVAIRATGERKMMAAENDVAQFIESEQMNSDSLLIHLTNVVRDYPKSALGHARLAGTLLNRFDILQKQSGNDMPVNQVRDAAQASKFSSSEQLRDWLMVAFGSNARLLYQAAYHARRAVELCPLQGEAYLHLAELCFLEGRGPTTFNALVKQSLLVRPCDVDVLYSVGKSQLIAGNTDEALRIWGSAFHGIGKHQRDIIGILAGNMNAVNFLSVFSPDWSSLEVLWLSYKQTGTLKDLQAILPFAHRAAQQEAPNASAYTAGKIWLALSRMQKDMQDLRGSFDSLQLAYEANPDSFPIRYELGKCLLSFQEYEVAEQHLRWCLNQRPDNPNIKAELLQASRGKLQRLARNSRSLIR